MQELTMQQAMGVGGGNLTQTGLFSPANIASATRFATGLGLLAGAATVGWHAGQWLNENTPIQDWIADVTG